MRLRKFAAIALVCIAPLSLSGCLILPGEFTSDMTVMKSGDFKFSYKGQIQLLGLANLLNNTIDGELGEGGEFEALCYSDGSEADGSDAVEANKMSEAEAAEDEAKKTKREEKAAEESAANAAAVKTMQRDSKGGAATSTAEEDPDLTVQENSDKPAEESASQAAEDAAAAAADAAAEAASAYESEERECNKDEIAEQKATWDEQQAEKKKKNEQQKKMFAMMLGGIDPKDPATIKRFTKEVERLAAWNKVEHLGDGLFMIDYSTSGRLADDFAFPVIPRYALGEPMIHITRWDNGRLRVEAPAFHNDPDFSAMAMMGAGSMMGMGGMGKTPKEPVAVKGTFTLTTDAKILANNTEEGPADKAGGLQVLTWDIGPASYGAPMALLKLVM
jgi:hypothetical protein